MVQNQDGTITFTAETEEVDKVTSVVDGGVRTVEYVASTSGLPNFFPSITRTVNYVASGVSAALNAISSASGKASTSGTAYNNGSAFYYGTAFSEGSAMWQHFRNASGNPMLAETGDCIMMQIMHSSMNWVVKFSLGTGIGQS